MSLKWVRSSRCDGGMCVEAALEWHSPSVCSSMANCVEVSWGKAEASGPTGACVEVGWGKSSASLSNGSCVEARTGACGLVHVRDSKLGDDSPVLDFTQAQWAELVREMQEFSLPSCAGVLPDGRVVLASRSQDLALVFTSKEWDAFEDGCNNGEFDYPSSQSISSGDVVAALEASGDPQGARVVRQG